MKSNRPKAHKRESNLFIGASNFFSDFCGNTSIHGFNHITARRRHWMERLIWIVVTAAAVWGAVSISLGQLQRYNENPTVVTLEKDFRNWRFHLPAITVCDWNRTDPAKVREYIKTTWQLSPDDEKYSYYEGFVYAVANSDLFHLEEFQKYGDDATLDVDLYKLAVDVMPDHQIKASWSDGFNTKWIPTMTEAGACYFTNSVAQADAAIGTLYTNVTAQFPLTHAYSSQSCFVMLEIATNADVYVHSPYDVMDVTSAPSRAFLTLNRVTELTVTETRCGRGVRELTPKRRRCLFTDEPPDRSKKAYSTNSCRRSCRNRLAIKLCGCRPFYNFYEEGYGCVGAGMRCLSAHAASLRTMAGGACDCAAQCVDALYRDVAVQQQLWEKGPFVHRASVRFTVQAPRTRYTREIVFHFQDLVVSFGGAAGLFLGASFISFVEILYLPLERMFCYTKRKEETEPRTSNTFESTRISKLTAILEDYRRYDEENIIGQHYDIGEYKEAGEANLYSGYPRH